MSDTPKDADLWAAWLSEDVTSKTPEELQARFDALIGVAEKAENEMARILEQLAWTNPEKWEAVLERHREKYRGLEEWQKKAEGVMPEPDREI